MYVAEHLSKDIERDRVGQHLYIFPYLVKTLKSCGCIRPHKKTWTLLYVPSPSTPQSSRHSF